jgi:dolichyl-phosphate beta-glucosyltransferase
VDRDVNLSIVIPAYHEAKRIGGSLEELSEFLKSRDYGPVEVIVAVAESTDATKDVAMSKSSLFQHFRVVDAGQPGKGRNVRAGMMEANGRIKLFMDADLATPLVHIDNVVAHMDKGAKVVICVRDLGTTHTGMRKLLSGSGNLLVQMLLLPGIRDTQCGFKAFESEAANRIFGRQTVSGWGFDMELLAIARKLGYTIDLVPAPDWRDVSGGPFSNAAVRGAFDTLVELMGIKWKMLTGRYRKRTFVYTRGQQ